jgi:hypothetical protein
VVTNLISHHTTIAAETLEQQGLPVSVHVLLLIDDSATMAVFV